MAQDLKRKLTAILSADVKGYSRLMGEDEEWTVRTLDTFKGVMNNIIPQHRGRVVDSTGDNLLAEFASVVDAVQAAVEIQQVLRAKNSLLPENRRMEFRIGINLGDVIEEGERIFGDGVNIAARLEGLAEAGGICISGSAFEQIENKLPLHYDYLGEHEVKNITRPVRVYRALMDNGVVKEKRARPKIQGQGQGQRVTVFGLIGALVIISGIALWQYARSPTSPTPQFVEKADPQKMAFPLPDKPSIAVLPFTNMSGDPKEDYFSDGLTEQIITSLSMIPRLFVIARNSTFIYKGKAIKVQAVAEEQGVRYVLEGGIQKSEDRVRITVQLIDAIKGHHLWSERYDRELKDLFVLQDDIVRQIMTAVQVKLTEGEYVSAIAGSTSNLKALECYWRALEHSNRWSKEENTASRQWAEKAIELDPNFAAAWAFLGASHNYDTAQGWSKSPAESLKRVEECVQKALSINESNPLALSLLGGIRRAQGKWDEALEYNEKALAINPNDPRIMWNLALTFEFIGRLDEAIALGQKILRISPYYPAMYLSYLASVYPAAGRYQETIQACELLLERSRKGEISPLYAHLYLAETYVGLGQLDKARAEAEKVMEINPKYSLEGHKRLTMYKDQTIGERRLAALRKAGLPDKAPPARP